MPVDMHLHSNCSDGSDSPARVVELAAQAGLSAISLTDHDTISGLATASRRAEEVGMAFLTGIELSVHISDRTVHLLGYGFDPTYTELQETLAGQQESRLARNQILVDRLIQLGYDISLDDIKAKANGATIGRPHFAAVLKDKNYVETIDQAFTELLGDGKPAYVERRELAASDAIALIHRAGGLAIWAHPTRFSQIDEAHFYKGLEELRASGIDGFECWYSRFAPEQRRRMARIARKYDLIPTGGSDYHGSYKPDLSVGVGTGDLQIPDAVFAQLRERLLKFSK